MIEVYGHPSKKEPHVQNYYCGMCNRIPILNMMDPVTEARLGKGIGELYGIPMQRMTKKGPKQIHLMVCRKCMRQVEIKMQQEIIKKFGVNPFNKRPPEDPPEGTYAH